MRNKTRSEKIFLAAVLALAVLRVFLQTRVPLVVSTVSPDDDMLMAAYADRMSVLHWLGAYGMRTLEKLPGYALFLAVSFWSHLPYMAVLGIFYAVCCLVFYGALKNLFGRPAPAFIGYVLLLFAPMMFDLHIGQRVYQMAVVPGLTVLTAAGLIGMFAQRREGAKAMLPWALAAGIGYGLYAVTRFDTVWLLALAAGAAFLGFLWWLAAGRKTYYHKAAGRSIAFFVVLLIPLLAAPVSKGVLRAVNGAVYGTAVTDDFNSGSFAEACTLILQLDGGEEPADDGVYVTRAALEKAYAASPTLAGLKPLMDEQYQTALSGGPLIAGEWEREYYAWQIRAAAFRAGHYTDARETEAFFGQIASELKAAYADGRLTKREGLAFSPFTALLTPERIGKIGAHVTAVTLPQTVRFAEMTCTAGAAQDNEYRAITERLVRTPVPAEGTASREELDAAWVRASHITAFVKVWQKAALPLALIVTVLAAVQIPLAFYLRKKAAVDGWVIAIEAGMFAAMLAALFIVSANFYAVSPESLGISRMYLAGGYTLWMVLVCLVLGETVVLAEKLKAA